MANNRWPLGISAAHCLPLTLGLSCGVVAWYFGLNQFPGYDASPMIDLAWRQLNGLHAHDDFFSPFPPTFGYPVRLAFQVFGIQWSSVILLNAIVCGVMVAVGYYWWSRLFGWIPAIIVFGLGALQTMVNVGFWWHNTFGSMIALLSVAGLLSAMRGKASPIAAAFVIGLAIAAKPNCTWPLLLGIFLTSISSIRMRKDIGMHSLIWGFGLAVALIIAELDGSAFGYIRDLAEIARHRGTSAFGWNYFRGLVATGLMNSDTGISIVITTLVSISILALSCQDQGISKVFSKDIGIRLGLLGSFAASLSLNSEALIVSWPLLTAALLMQPMPASQISRKLATALSAILIIPAAHAVQWTGERDRVRGAGPGTFWEIPEWSAPSHNGFFAGSVIGRRLTCFNQEVEDVLRRHPSASVFFGPRVEFGYAAFSIFPSLRLPLWWDKHQSWPFRNEKWMATLMNGWQDSDFDVLIFNRNIYTYKNDPGTSGHADMYDMPDFIKRDIRNRYVDVSEKYGLRSAVVLVKSHLQPQLSSGKLTTHGVDVASGT